MVVAVRVGQWYGWMTGIAPLLLATGAGYIGMLDLLNRPLFHLEVDRRGGTAGHRAAGEGARDDGPPCRRNRSVTDRPCE